MDPTAKPKTVGTLQKKKNNNKKGLGSCFRPVVADCAPLGPRGLDGQPVLAFVPFSPPPKDMDGRCLAGKDQFNRRSFSRVVKAVLFGTSVVKKFRKTKQRGKTDQTEKDSNSKSEPKKIPNPLIVPIWQKSSDTEDRRTTSSPSVSSSSSTLKSPSTSSNSSRSKTSRMRETDGKFGNYGSDVGLCLVLISLLVLLFWGKICAILCTSSWLFFAPRLRCRFRSSDAVGLSMEMDSEEHKKKVVLEGLLERNRFRDQ